MNYFSGYGPFRNQFFFMRHGESEANVAGIIISEPSLGVAGYGLTPNGKEQAQRSTAAFPTLGASIKIISSDFLRALQTAAIVREHLHSEAVATATELRERYFGQWDQTNAENYAIVWQADRANPEHNDRGVEPATAVMSRVTEFVVKLDRIHTGQQFLVVAHGDILQILQAAAEQRPASEHRDVAHLENAVIRELLCREST